MELAPGILDVLRTRRKSLGNAYPLQGGASPFGSDVQLPSKLDIDENRMSLVVPIADGTRRDGVGDLLDPLGIVTERHRMNAIVLFDHAKQVTLPLGMAWEIDEVTGRYNRDKYTFSVDPITHVASDNCFFYRGKGMTGVDRKQESDHALFCEQVYHMAATGMLGAGSIGYQVIQAEHLPPDPRLGIPAGLHLKKILKLEGSLTILPANMDTVRKTLCTPKMCGKPLSPYLIKSLIPFAPPRKARMFTGEKGLYDQLKGEKDPGFNRTTPSPVNAVKRSWSMADAEKDGMGHGIFIGSCGHELKKRVVVGKPYKEYRISDRVCGACAGRSLSALRGVAKIKALRAQYKAIDNSGKPPKPGKPVSPGYVESPVPKAPKAAKPQYIIKPRKGRVAKPAPKPAPPPEPITGDPENTRPRAASDPDLTSYEAHYDETPKIPLAEHTYNVKDPVETPTDKPVNAPRKDPNIRRASRAVQYRNAKRRRAAAIQQAPEFVRRYPHLKSLRAKYKNTKCNDTKASYETGMESENLQPEEQREQLAAVNERLDQDYERSHPPERPSAKPGKVGTKDLDICPHCGGIKKKIKAIGAAYAIRKKIRSHGSRATGGTNDFFATCQRDTTGHCMPKGSTEKESGEETSGEVEPPPEEHHRVPAAKPTRIKPKLPDTYTVIAKRNIIRERDSGQPVLFAKRGEKLIVVGDEGRERLKVRRRGGFETVVGVQDIAAYSKPETTQPEPITPVEV